MITIQKALPKHIDILIDFQHRLAYESEEVTLDATTLRKGMEAMFADPGKGVYYIASDGNDIVGCHSITYEWSDWRNGLFWWIQSVYVDPNWRRRGVFRRMLEQVMASVCLCARVSPQDGGLQDDVRQRDLDDTERSKSCCPSSLR